MDPFFREVAAPLLSTKEAPTRAKRTFGLARAASEIDDAIVESAPTISVQPEATSEAGASAPLAASKATDASFAAPARAVATGSVAASPWAPEMAAQTFAEAAGVAVGAVEQAPRATVTAVAVVARAAMVRLFTCDAFRRGFLLPNTLPARRPRTTGGAAHLTRERTRRDEATPRGS